MKQNQAKNEENISQSLTPRLSQIDPNEIPAYERLYQLKFK